MLSILEYHKKELIF